MGTTASNTVSSSTCPVPNSPEKCKSSEKESAECLFKSSAANKTDSTSKCPVSRNVENKYNGCPMKRDLVKKESEGNQTSGQSSAYKNPSMFNVYSVKIDPSNQMPSNANQVPAPNQQVPLSTSRVPSSIPKGGTDNDTWTYPSPQMFWNALVRKEKTEGVSEQDIDTVIAIHNNMNESTWSQVMEWEKLHISNTKTDETATTSTGREPKLLKFCGRPDELSPKARLKILFGHPAPFDRHDWTVDRGGEIIRYVIDYYHDESAVQKDKTPKQLSDVTSMQSIKVDVRPALDSPSAVFDRFFIMPYRLLTGTTNYNPPSFFPPRTMITAELGKLDRIKADWKNIADKCASKKDKLSICASEDECRAASVALQLCTASVVCPSVALEFQQCTESLTSPSKDKQQPDLKRTGVAYTAMLQCLELFEIDSRKELGSDKRK